MPRGETPGKETKHVQETRETLKLPDQFPGPRVRILNPSHLQYRFRGSMALAPDQMVFDMGLHIKSPILGIVPSTLKLLYTYLLWWLNMPG